MADAVLVLNAGSSSLKFAVFGVGSSCSDLHMNGEIASDPEGFRFVARDAVKKETLTDQRVSAAGATSLPAAMGQIISWIEQHLGNDVLVAAGHRIVHGGPHYLEPTLISDAVLQDLEGLTPLAPLHQPASLAPVTALKSARPDLRQVACFDTAFHATLPEVETRIALPDSYLEGGIRRYGFHGLSYTHQAEQLKRRHPDLAKGRVVVAHLGSGASLCALQASVSVSTTMGFSVLDGLLMATRCGHIDPGVLLYLMRERQMTVSEVETLLYRKSGLFGISGGVSDMRALRQEAASNAPARLALDVFVRRLVRNIASQTAVLGGLDALIFTAGIGEHDAALREEVCLALEWLGVRLDHDANQEHHHIISTTHSPVMVLIEPAGEEMVISRQTMACLNQMQMSA